MLNKKRFIIIETINIADGNTMFIPKERGALTPFGYNWTIVRFNNNWNSIRQTELFNSMPTINSKYYYKTKELAQYAIEQHLFDNAYQIKIKRANKKSEKKSIIHTFPDKSEG